MVIFRNGFGTTQVLQINASIIAGILVLMTVGSFNQPNHLLTGSIFKTINQWVSFNLAFFAVSSLLALIASIIDDADENVLKHIAWASALSMMGGFVYLIWLVILIGMSLQ